MEDYWDDYNTYDQTVAELKASLISSVKTDVKEKIETLQKENAELKARLSGLDQLEAEAKTAKKNAEYAISTAERTVRYKKAKELFKEIAQERYLITYRHFHKDLCGKCEDRKVEFTYPSGKKGYEPCELCGGLQTEKIVVEAIGTECDIRNGELLTWWQPYRSWEDEESHSMHSSIKKKFIGQAYEDLNEYNTLFDSKEEAQKYADFLNTRNK